MSDGQQRTRIRIALLLVAVVLVGFQMRGPLVSLAPLARVAQADWGIAPAAFGLLTTVPLLCFSLAAPLAALLARRVGVEWAIEICLAGITVATALRAIDGFGTALAASVLLGLAITIGNVLLPTVIRRDAPRPLWGAATAMYAVSTNVGTMITALATAPLATVFGWRAAGAAWSVAGVVTAAVWLLLMRGPRPVEAAERTRTPFRPDRLAVLLAVVFGAQSASFYGVTTWLPTLLADERGFSAEVAGSASSVFQLAGIAGAVGVPVLALRLRPRTVIAMIGVLWITLPVILIVAPEHFLIGSITGGIAQGGGFTAVMTIIAEAGGDTRRTTALSAFVQSLGYLVAAAAPPLVGGVHTLTGNWAAPMLIVVGTTAAFLVSGVLAATVADPNRRGGPAAPAR